MQITLASGRQIEVSPLDAIRIVATAKGYGDIDCEPTGSAYKVTAYKDGSEPLVVKGESWQECANKFLARVA